jgi:hypothetical protein
LLYFLLHFLLHFLLNVLRLHSCSCSFATSRSW